MKMRLVSICTVSGGLWFAVSPLDAQQPAKTFVVNSAADTDDFNPNSGVMTLRKALRMADETPALDEIDFNIPGASTIQVNGSFGSLGAVQPVIVDGTTQPGGRVSLDGSMAGSFDPSGREISGFELVGAGSTLKGFSIHDFAFDGVLLRPSGAPITGSNTVSGNFIHDNKRHGVHIIASQGNLVGGTMDGDGNRIESNQRNGIHIEGQDAADNVVSRNTIGGLLPLQSNGGDCIVIQDAPETTIGTASPVAAGAASPGGGALVPQQAAQNGGNTLNGTNNGIFIGGLAAETTRIVDNLIGTQFAGAKLTNGIIHRGGDLLSVEGNAFENVGGIQLDAEFSIGTKYSIKANHFLANAELAAKILVTGNLNVTIDVVDNDIIGSIRGLAFEETAGNGSVNWNIIGSEATGDNKSKEGMSLTFRAGGMKRIVGGPGGFGRGHFSGYAEGNFKLNQTIAPGVGARLQIIGGAYENSGVGGATPHPGIEGRVQASAQFPIDILDVVGSGNTTDGVSLALVPSLSGRIDVTANGCRIMGNAGFGIALRNGTDLINLVSIEAQRDFLDHNTQGAWFLLGVERKFTILENTITDNDGPGITLAGGSDMHIADCLISGNPIGVLIKDTAHASLSNNVITANGIGLATEGTGFATLGPNSFLANTGLGIDLGNDGVTPNDLGDLDGRQNFPVLTSAASSGAGTSVAGTLNSTPNQMFTVAFFATSVPDPSGYGEGEAFLGSMQVPTDASGNASFIASLPVAVAAGAFVTATATSEAGNTSEFAFDIPVAGLNADLALNKAASPGSVPAGSSVTYTIVVQNNGPAAAANVVVTDDLPPNTVFVSSSATGGGISGGTGNHRTITFASLANGASATITLVATISASAPTGTAITNTASVSSSGAADPNPQNNASTATTTVAPPGLPPVIAQVSVTPSSLWPPNHKMVPVTVTYQTAGGSGALTCTLSVTSDEPVNGTGDGDTAPDWTILDDHHVLLRAERAPKGHGRIYIIQITCRDSAGLTAMAQVIVTVPHDQGGK